MIASTTSPDRVTAFTEKPVLFGRSRSLVGVVCAPSDPNRAADRPAVVFLNSGIIHRVGPNRLYVAMARELAKRGFASLRFDLGGIGDSYINPEEKGSVLDLVYRDIADAIKEAARLSARGKVVLVGLCSGADNALQAAVNDPRIEGIVPIDPNVHQPLSFHVYHFARRIADPKRLARLLTGRHPIWGRLAARLTQRGSDAADVEESPFLAPAELPPRQVMAAQLDDLVNRGCRLLFVFSGGLQDQYNHENQIYHLFPRLRRQPAVSLGYFGDADHTFSDPRLQQEMIDTVVRWMDG